MYMLKTSMYNHILQDFKWTLKQYRMFNSNNIQENNTVPKSIKIGHVTMSDIIVPQQPCKSLLSNGTSLYFATESQNAYTDLLTK